LRGGGSGLIGCGARGGHEDEGIEKLKIENKSGDGTGWEGSGNCDVKKGMMLVEFGD